jgi:RNA-directed DNA polymerase
MRGTGVSTPVKLVTGYAVAKHTFSMLDHFGWWRLIWKLKRRHHWNWTDVPRSLVTATGKWQPISADGIELRPIAAISITRHR